MILIAASALVLLLPLTAHAATSLFNDVPDSSIFVDDINWMKTAGITNGCNSAGTEYRPENNVTRQQMAAFMYRLAIKRVVDAGTLDGKDGTNFVFNAEWQSKSLKCTNITPGAQVTLDNVCPTKKYVVSGGGQSSYKQLLMATSQPLGTTTWRATWTNTGATTISPTVTVWAMCAGSGLISLNP